MDLMDKWNYSIFFQEALSQIQESYIQEGKGKEFEMWFSFEYHDSTENTIKIIVPSNFFKDQLISRGYIALLEQKLEELSGKQITIEFFIQAKKEENIQSHNLTNDIKIEKKEIVQKPVQNSKGKHPQLREDYIFDNFIIGDNNTFAFNAASAISKNPGKAYNPLLIYGGVGLGKTHIMQAIGNYTHQNTDLKTIYITAESFTNEFIQALNDRTIPKFKNKYRNADVLLIDDIHFLQNKTETQEELFHTFNVLHDAFKQMVFTCDRPLSEIKNLSDRLRSRFERGLTVDLSPPQYETRRAIIVKKLELMNKKISDDIIDLIAENVVSNVRDLEAAITKIIAYTELIGKTITLEIAKQQLRDAFTSPRQGNISIEKIQKIVADHYNLSFTDLKARKRTKNIATARQIAMYIAREITEFSTTEVGAEFGGRDHTTVMHACQKIEELVKTDTHLQSNIHLLINTIKDAKK
jgi:chromosomal replication initiator protein